MSTERMRNRLVSRVWLLHALYFAIGGVWAVVGRRSFEAITGRKTDYWLVRTVGGLLTAVGAVIGLAGLNRRITAETACLAISTSAVLALIDVIYVGKRRISPVYLLDTIANSVLIAGWLGFEQRRRTGSDPD